jgi:translation initiation factor IF-1
MGKKKNSASSFREQRSEESKEREDKIELQGVVEEALPGTLFKVKAESGITVLCTISGKLRQNHIHVLPADRVMIEVSPYDPTRGRICWRL